MSNDTESLNGVILKALEDLHFHANEVDAEYIANAIRTHKPAPAPDVVEQARVVVEYWDNHEYGLPEFEEAIVKLKAAIAAMGDVCPSGSRIGSTEAKVQGHTGSNPVASPTTSTAGDVERQIKEVRDSIFYWMTRNANTPDGAVQVLGQVKESLTEIIAALRPGDGHECKKQPGEPSEIPVLNLQERDKAIYQTLSGDSVLSKIVTGIYERPPQGAEYPYIYFGDAGDKWFELVILTREGGRKQASAIMERIHTLLSPVHHFVKSNIKLWDDGWTYSGVLEFKDNAPAPKPVMVIQETPKSEPNLKGSNVHD